MRKPVVAVLVGLSLFSQASFANSRGDIEAWIEHLSDGSTAVPHQSLEEIRPESDSSFWKTLLVYSKDLKTQYVDEMNVSRAVGGATLATGALFVAQSAVIETAMRIYGVKSPQLAMKMLFVDVAGDLPRISIRWTTPGSPRNLRYQKWVNAFNELGKSNVPWMDEMTNARQIRRSSRILGVAGLGLVVGGKMLMDSAKPRLQESIAMEDGFEDPNKVIELLASEKSNAEILEMAQKDEALRFGIQAAAEKMHALEMWAEISQ